MKLNFALSFRRDREPKQSLVQAPASCVCVSFCFIGLLLNVKHTIRERQEPGSVNSALKCISIGCLSAGLCLTYKLVVWILVSHHQSALAQASHQIFGNVRVCTVFMYLT